MFPQIVSELEHLYSPSRWSKRFSPEAIIENHINVTAKATSTARQNIPCELDISYGSLSKEKLDIYGTDLKKEAPIFIYIHGGYYQEECINKNNSAHFAKELYKIGVKCIVVGYELCPKVTLSDIDEEIIKALDKCIDYVKDSSSRAIFIGGHSVGAHAVATLFQNHIHSLPPDIQELFKAAFLISGIYNLTPLISTTVNNFLKLTDVTSKLHSPMLRKLNFTDSKTEFLLTVGRNDSPKFVQESKEFYEKLKEENIKATFLKLDNIDHFDIVEHLTDSSLEPTKTILSCIKKFL